MNMYAPSVRSRLALLVVACLVPASLFAVCLFWTDYHRARDQLAGDSVITARAMALLIDKEFAIIEATLEALATSPSLAAGDFDAFQAQAALAMRDRKLINIVLSDADGRQSVNTLLPFGTPLPRSNPAAPYKTVSVTGKPAISAVFVGAASQRPVVALGVPAIAAGARTTLSAAQSVTRFGKLLSEQNLPADWIVAVVDQGGTVVARSHAAAGFVGKPITPDLAARIAAADEAGFDGSSNDGTPVLAVFSHAPQTRWTVVIGIPSDALRRDVNLRFTWLALSSALLLGASLVVAWCIGGTIARSVRALEGPALALGEGHAVAFAPTELRETDEVGQALVKASAMILHASYRANHDPLTGLPNRALFTELLDQHLAACARNASHLSVLYLDLDGFKQVNDVHGHALGDRLLKIVAQRLRAIIRTSDVIARLGGDEFVVVLAGAAAREAALVAAKLIDSLGAPYALGGATAVISASIGLAHFPACGNSAKRLLQRADEAMYQAKLDGKGRFVVVHD